MFRWSVGQGEPALRTESVMADAPGDYGLPTDI